MSLQDEPPSRSKVDASEFFFDGSGLSALLIHGLTGTPYEIGFTADLSQQFANFGNGLKNGFTGYFNYLNQHGGVNSHPVHVTALDDQASTSKGNANFIQLVTQQHVSAVGGFLVSNKCGSAAPLAASARQEKRSVWT